MRCKPRPCKLVASCVGAHDERNNPARVVKVKAHAGNSTSGDFSAFLADGNSFADAGAKEGRSLHPLDPEAEVFALRA